MLVGSEGILGVIVDAWVRVRERPSEKVSAGSPSTTSPPGRRRCGRSPRPGSTHRTAACSTRRVGDLLRGLPGEAMLVLGFESAHHPVEDAMALAIDAATAHGGSPARSSAIVAAPGPKPAQAPAPSAPGEDPVDAWRHAFLYAPYLRDSLVACGVLSDTFETAITWDRFPDFHAEVMEPRDVQSPSPAARPPRSRLAPDPAASLTSTRRPGPLLHRGRARPARLRGRAQG